MTSEQADLDSLDATLVPVSKQEVVAALQEACTCACGGGDALCGWLARLLVGDGAHGLCMVLRFLDRRGGPQFWQENRLHMAVAVLQRLSVNQGGLAGLGLNLFRDARTLDLLLSLATGLLAGLGHVPAPLPEYPGDTQRALAATCDAEHRLRLHLATVGLLSVAQSVSTSRPVSAILAEIVTYLWALAHATAVDSSCFDRCRDSAARSHEFSLSALRRRLWRVVSSDLGALLCDREVVDVLCLSDDNAMILAPVRWALGNVGSHLPVFASREVASSSAAAAAGSTGDGLAASRAPLNLHGQSWCPPGRVCLAALVLLAPLRHLLSAGCADLFGVLLDAAVRVVAMVPRPGNLLHSPDDVLALLSVAVTTILAAQRERDNDNDLGAVRNSAGALLVSLLHRPPIEAILAPRKPVEALNALPQGLQALRWCAGPAVAETLGGCGVRARALLLEAEHLQEEAMEEKPCREGTALQKEPRRADCSSCTFTDGLSPARMGELHPEGLDASEGAGGERARVDAAAPLREPDAAAAAEAVAAARLQAEVDALGAELGCIEAELEAELDAELMEEERTAPAMPRMASPEPVSPRHGLAVGGAADLVRSCGTGSVARPAGSLSREPRAESGQHSQPCAPMPREALPEEAARFLGVMMAGEAGLAPVRDRVLASLVRTCEQGSSLSEFQAAALLDVYQEPCDEVPSTRDVRLALQYLFENMPEQGLLEQPVDDQQDIQPESTSAGSDSADAAASVGVSESGQPASSLAGSGGSQCLSEMD